jgi:hypothetical protein
MAIDIVALDTATASFLYVESALVSVLLMAVFSLGGEFAASRVYRRLTDPVNSGGCSLAIRRSCGLPSAAGREPLNSLAG